MANPRRFKILFTEINGGLFLKSGPASALYCRCRAFLYSFLNQKLKLFLKLIYIPLLPLNRNKKSMVMEENPN
jgi:hypothetical protein